MATPATAETKHPQTTAIRRLVLLTVRPSALNAPPDPLAARRLSAGTANHSPILR
jgi:hypothetical protein